MVRQAFKFLIILMIFTACSNIQKQEICYKILTPKPNWTYYSDSRITFSTNINTDDVKWYSSKDGYLGNGNGFALSLTPGDHEVKAILHDSEKTVSIYVDKCNVKSGQTFKYIIDSTNQDIKLPQGVYKPALVALEGSVSCASICENNHNIELKKDIHIDTNIKGKKIIQDSGRFAKISGYKLNDEKTFYVINTRHESLEPHKILAKVIKTSESYNIWYPVNPEKYSSLKLDEDALNLCIEDIENRIIPRLNTLWGKLPDIDNDGKISFLFTPTINEEQSAIGFFNPEDFYKRDDSSPYSNEMDVLYIAVPEPKKISYSIKCISATIAHELTHAINYNIKTYSRVLNNEKNPPKEEIFLDEAMSHLSESLCGYGISGGNIGILFHYLNNLGKYSVCRNDYLGNADSNGRRGAATMFLSWLFWKKGGISWNQNNPLEIIDEGGIDFIQKLVVSDGCGWENIGKVFGKNTDVLYVQMVEELNAHRENASPSVIDPYSKEPVMLYPDSQTYGMEGSEKKWTLSIPMLDEKSPVSLVPYSFALFGDFDCKSIFNIKTSAVKGQALACFALNNKVFP